MTRRSGPRPRQAPHAPHATRALARGLLFVGALLVTGCLSFHRGPMAGEPRNARFADVEGVRVRYTDTADGDAARAKPAVVLVHGFASALDVWDGVAPALAEDYRVLALDLKGFGWTERPEGDYSPDAQARLLLKLLDERGIARAALVAHSWGASVALSAALQAPGRVSRIALYDAWVYEDELPMFFHWARAPGVGEALFGLFYKQRADERIAQAFYDHAYVNESFVEAVDAALERPGTLAAALAAVRGQRFAELEGRYPTISKPVLLMWGREDVVTPLRFGERLSRDLPGARLTVYPRCGHFPMIEARAASNRELAAFLEPERSAAHAPLDAPDAPGATERAR